MSNKKLLQQIEQNWETIRHRIGDEQYMTVYRLNPGKCWTVHTFPVVEHNGEACGKTYTAGYELSQQDYEQILQMAEKSILIGCSVSGNMFLPETPKEMADSAERWRCTYPGDFEETLEIYAPGAWEKQWKRRKKKLEAMEASKE